MKPLTLTMAAKPLTANQARRLHHFDLAKRVREFHDAYYFLARQAGSPRFGRVHVVAGCLVKGRLFDADAIAPTVKAALDGIVLAGCLEDDGPGFVASVTYLAPEKAGHDEIRISLTEAVWDEQGGQQ